MRLLLAPRSSAPGLLTLLAGILLAAPLALAFQEGPLPGLTGGFGEPTCQVCHFENALNDPAGALRLAGVPRSYTPGAPYAITIALRRPGLTRGGFQLTARFAAGPEAGREAGTIAVPDDRIQIVTAPDRPMHYVQHTVRGTQAATPGEVEWRINWTAPASGAVVFHVAANATNDDQSALGDFIYAQSATTQPAHQQDHRGERAEPRGHQGFRYTSLRPLLLLR
jgi:hypothetical protein